MTKNILFCAFLILQLSTSFCAENITQATLTETSNCIVKNNVFLECDDALSIVNWISSANLNVIEEIEKLTIENWQEKVVKPSIFKNFTNLREFTLKSGNLTKFLGDFPALNYLEKINVTDNKIKDVYNTLFKNLPELKTVDLRRNNLQTITKAFILAKNFSELYLFGNHWDCTKPMKWLLNVSHSSYVADLQTLKCSDKKYHTRHLVTVMEYNLGVKESCRKSGLKNCTCSIYYMQREGSPSYSVNCSNRGFYSLPEILPLNTTVLYISHNNISDLRPLVTNSLYHDIDDIYLNNNLVTSIEVLENSVYLNNFRLLSLESNKISKISVFPLKNAFSRNPNLQSVFLSQNPWTCNCKFTPKFQQLLAKFEFIRDARNITCRFEQDNPFSNRPVMSLTKNELCHQENEEFLVIDIVNCILGLLIFVILAKLFYDYIQYRHYGRIPWLVKII
ncbi:protein singed wings 2 [Culicoides brevitarsis]|uniref:protein singed wings 2 n=1 Tax=Culicoides brevitarsis TaxID=469753 RepID=UPI00307BFE47